jgi:hypothetical protein
MPVLALQRATAAIQFCRTHTFYPAEVKHTYVHGIACTPSVKAYSSAALRAQRPDGREGQVRLVVVWRCGGRNVLECSCGQGGQPGEAGHNAGALEQSAKTHQAG